MKLEWMTRHLPSQASSSEASSCNMPIARSWVTTRWLFLVFVSLPILQGKEIETVSWKRLKQCWSSHYSHLLNPWDRFLNSIINTKKLKKITGSKVIHHGEDEFQEIRGIVAMLGPVEMGKITTLCPLCNYN